MSSLWLNYKDKNLEHEKINSNQECDICIIGGGIFGLTCAYYLSKKFKVIVLEKEHYLASKVSGHTTAKITYQHNLIYDHLIKSYNSDFAKKYLIANKKAISNIKEIIDKENIKCDFEYLPNIVYTTKKDETINIINEVNALKSLGEEAEFITSSSLPFEIEGGIKLNNHAQFHPVKYMDGLAKTIIDNNSKIYCDSTAYDFKKGNEKYIVNVNNFNIKAKYIIIASHYPFKNFPGFHFAKMYQSTSYVLGIDTHSELFNEMYINNTPPIYSLKSAIHNGKRILLLGGNDHKTGYAPDENTYSALEKFAKKYYPNSEILFKWNTEDCISLDKIPYIGRFSSLMPNVYVGTGFNKWGMTSSNVAANIIKDLILEKDNKYSEIFNSLRLEAIKNKTEVKNMGTQIIQSFITTKLKIPKEEIEKIKKDNGAIIKIEGQNVGIYKDPDGKIFAVSPICTHLGCLLTWNNLEKTWDCPCHGSRFDYTGKNLYDPAITNLKVIDLW